MGKNAGAAAGCVEVWGTAAATAELEVVTAAAAPVAAVDDADTKGGDNKTSREGEQPRTATAGPFDG